LRSACEASFAQVAEQLKRNQTHCHSNAAANSSLAPIETTSRCAFALVVPRHGLEPLEQTVQHMDFLAPIIELT
jgi:hypothetical protein